MFCYQCQEAAKGTGCTSAGICGKTNTVANYQDLLIYTLKGLSIYSVEARKSQIDLTEINSFIIEGLFSTITNANFNKDVIIDKIKLSLKLRYKIKNELIRKNIDKRFSKETGLPVHIANDPLACVAIGTGKALDQEETFSTMLSEY